MPQKEIWKAWNINTASLDSYTVERADNGSVTSYSWPSGGGADPTTSATLTDRRRVHVEVKGGGGELRTIQDWSDAGVGGADGELLRFESVGDTQIFAWDSLAGLWLPSYGYTIPGRPVLPNELFVWDAISTAYHRDLSKISELNNYVGVTGNADAVEACRFRRSGLNNRPSIQLGETGSGSGYKAPNSVNVSGSAPWTIVVAGAFSPYTGIAYNHVLGWGAAGSMRGTGLMTRRNSNFEWSIATYSIDSTVDIATGVQPRSTGDVVIVTHDGTLTRIVINGVDGGSKSLPWSLSTANGLSIGHGVIAAEIAQGFLGAVVFANYAATEVEQTAITQYYSERYGIPSL